MNKKFCISLLILQIFIVLLIQCRLKLAEAKKWTTSLDSNYGKVSYKGYKIYSIEQRNEKHAKFVKSIHNGKVKGAKLMVAAIGVGRRVQVLVAPKSIKSFLSLVSRAGAVATVRIDDVGQLIDSQQRPGKSLRQSSGLAFYRSYPRHSGIVKRARELVDKYPRNVQYVRLGSTSNAAEIFALKLASTSTSSNSNKPIVFIDAGVHAREWLAPLAAFHLIESLLDSGQVVRSSDPNKQRDRRLQHRALNSPLAANTSKLLDDYDVYVVPLVNIDGYEYSHTTDRMWRKTLSRSSQQSESKCFGVDLNRNFPRGWQRGAEDAESSASLLDSCNDQYRGPKALSEPEAAAIANFLSSNKSKVKFYAAIHTYGNMILYAYGDTTTLSEFNSELFRVAEAGTKENFEVSYQVGSISTTMNARVYGIASDYASSIKIPYSYTLELGDEDDGFMTAPEKILPTCVKTSRLIMAMINAINN